MTLPLPFPPSPRPHRPAPECDLRWSDAYLAQRIQAAVRDHWFLRLGLPRNCQSAAVAALEAAGLPGTDATQAAEHLDPLCELLGEVAQIAGFRPGSEVRWDRRLDLPGYYRATKRWDLVVMRDGWLHAAIEAKSMASSYSSNVNNRVEEAIGSGTDLREARKPQRERGERLWLGYVFLLRDEHETRRPPRDPLTPLLPDEMDPVFPLRPSIVERFGILCERLAQSGLYDATAFLTSPRHQADARGVCRVNASGAYRDDYPGAQAVRFVRAFYAHLVSVHDQPPPEYGS